MPYDNLEKRRKMRHTRRGKDPRPIKNLHNRNDGGSPSKGGGPEKGREAYGGKSVIEKRKYPEGKHGI